MKHSNWMGVGWTGVDWTGTGAVRSVGDAVRLSSLTAVGAMGADSAGSMLASASDDSISSIGPE